MWRFIELILILCTFCIANCSVAKPHDSNPKSRTFEKELSESPHSINGAHSAIYDHEAFLGKSEAKRFDDLTPEESKKSLGEIFDKIDTNKDGKVSADEMSTWISKVSKKMLYTDVDRSWKEYGLSKGDTLTWERYLEDLIGEDGEYEDEDEASKKNLLQRDERRWRQADEDKDGRLSKLELLSFLHPEHFPKMRDVVVKETMEDVDKNGDGFIDIEEYIKDLWSDQSSIEPEWVKNEREEFVKTRDINGDGKLDLDEVAKWIVPDDFNHVEAEVKHLFSESDEDEDGFLTKNEMLNRYDLFVGSQATNFGEILTAHDEL